MKRTWFVLLCALVIIGTFSSCQSNSQKQEINLSNTKVAFESWRDGNSEIYIMNPDGSEQTRLTNNPAYDGYPRWSPDGKKIAFVSDRDGNPEIYIMNSNGSNQTRLTNHPAEDMSPTWSPDGSMIAFNTRRFEGGGSEILRRNIEAGQTWGLNPSRLTFSKPTNSALADDFISWSPDGKQIAFESDRDRDDPEIYLINAVDGTNTQRLTFTRALDEVPSWSPDSKQILFSSDRHAEPHNGNYEIYIMNRDGSDMRRLTNLPGQDTYPSMSPDGSMIVFESWQHGHPEIYRMNADGSNVVRLTTYQGKQVIGEEESGGNGNPSWSPFFK
ncbi:MAG: DPP IV N-terminal domain-containing protein [bacterium]